PTTKAVVKLHSHLSLSTDLVLPLLQTRVRLLHHRVELLRDLDVHTRLSSGTLRAETVVEPVTQDLRAVAPLSIVATESTISVGRVQVHARLEQLHVLQVSTVSSNRARVNLVQVNSDQDFPLISEENAAFDVLPAALAQNRQS